MGGVPDVSESAAESDVTEVIPRLFIGNWHEARSARDLHFAVAAVVKTHRTGARVLVHCVGGRSRSAVVVVGAMVKIENRPMCEMYDLLLAKHDCTRIHPYLAKFLTENGNELHCGRFRH